MPKPQSRRFVAALNAHLVEPRLERVDVSQKIIFANVNRIHFELIELPRAIAREDVTGTSKEDELVIYLQVNGIKKRHIRRDTLQGNGNETVQIRHDGGSGRGGGGI